MEFGSNGRAVIIGREQRKMRVTGKNANPVERPMVASAVCGLFLVTTRWLMPMRERENDVGGRFTNHPGRNSPAAWLSRLVFSSGYAPAAASGVADRAFPGRTGATPCLECPVRAWGGVGFYKRHPTLSGGRSRPRINPYGKAEPIRQRADL